MPRRKTYRVLLTEEERHQLEQQLHTGSHASRELDHLRVLLKADESPGGPAWTDAAICAAVEVSPSTVSRIRHRFHQSGLRAALKRRPLSRTRSRRLDGAAEAQLIALACSTPPAGNVRWTLRLLSDRMVELEHVVALSHETVRQILKKASLSLGK
jgi:transposase